MEKTILDELKSEIESINVWARRYEPDNYLDQRPQIVQKVKDHVLEIINTYRKKERNKE